MLRSRALVLLIACASLASCKLFKKRHRYSPSSAPYTASTATSTAADNTADPDLDPVLPSGRGGFKLTESYSSNNSLITVKYPSDWKASTIGESVIQISRSLLASEDEDLTFISIPVPVSSKVQDFNNLLVGAEIPKLNSYKEVSRKTTKCGGGVTGVEIEATWVPPNYITYKRWTCTFLKDGHGYSFAYDLPKSKVARDDGLLRAIVDSTSFSAL